ncbi:ABC transporter permease (plasmid) [Rhizobium rosettiformans]|uniref:ABC transporter permease n=1 Tax=Rhizobium rosettiformans TaxID=1368430 RepID=A0ABX7F222_9HYPH|nr:ABC transporter permease [Rhizobium rosettiformans]QRF54245.1 ABC transporter permease [Rhizobium rosettiformans]
MSNFVVRRLLSVIPIALIVLVTVFLLLHIGPGDAAALIAGENATPDQIESIRERLFLDRPLYEQLFIYLSSVVRFDLGQSVYSGFPVVDLILQRVEPTAMLALSTLILSVLIAVPMGVWGAWRAGSTVDTLLIVASVVGFSVPVFVIGYVLVDVFALRLGWLPVQGYKPLSTGLLNCLRSITLPSITLAFLFSALVARITRATMLEVLAEDYIRTARAKGAGNSRILLVHALKNIGVPVVTVIGTSFAALLGGVVITESVFNIPGMGRLTVDAIQTRDYPVVQGVLIVFSFVLIAVNLLVDLSYALFDPRVRQ